MVLNVFTHATGLEVGRFFDDSSPQISTNTREYQGESSVLSFPSFRWVFVTPFCSVPILPPSFKLPGFLIPSELSVQSHMLIPSSSFVLWRPTLVFLSTPSLRHQTSLVSRHTMHCLYTSDLSTTSPRPRTSPHRRCALQFKNSRFPSTSKIKLLTIRVTSKTLRVIHVIGSQHLPQSVK
jgi:hypothetical protein